MVSFFKSPIARHFAKLAVSISIVVFIAAGVNWENFFGTITRADYVLMMFTFVLLWVERLWSVYKWRFLLSLKGEKISLWTLFCISNIGAFWGLFLPSSLGTDVVRGVYLSRNISNPELAAASVVVDRMMGLFSLLFLCVTSLLVYSSLFNNSLIYLVLVLVACTLLGAYVAFWEPLPDIIEAKVPFFSRNRVGKKIINMHRVFLSYKQYPGALRTSFTFSLILQMI
ncbi:MAG: flippase-like domain-containing protein, partial [Desulfobulbaceae bacterium]|nr:flippase-like domain-containing protein [Desulfobulbaceae bacterium]